MMSASRITSVSSRLLLLPLLWGCGEKSNSDAVAMWHADSTAVLEVGRNEGDPVYQLFRVRGIAELPDGGIAIANAGTSEIRVYDADGQFVRALGRSGGGPGEFTMLRNLRVCGDTLIAYDRVTGRLTRFHISGAYLDDSVLQGTTSMVPNFAGLLDDGTAVGWVDKLAPGVEGFRRDSAVLLRFRTDGSAHALGNFAGRELIFHSRDMGGGLVAASGYTWGFYRTFLAIAAGDRIYAGVTDSAAIHVWSGAGATQASLRGEEVPLALDDAAADALFEEETRNLAPAEREEERKEMRGAPRPPTAPVFDRLVLSPDGELWVRRFDRPGAALSEWLVFDTSGSLRARVAIRRGREILTIGQERIYTLERDEFDVEYVRGYRLSR
jgi:hypothetical protein